MRPPAPVELVVDCPSCLLERGVIETYDAMAAACRFGLPARTRCRLCDESFDGTLDRPVLRPLLELPSNRCPACTTELSPDAVDRHGCAGCGANATLERRTEPRSFATPADVFVALDAWAERDGYRDRHELVRAVFVLGDDAKVAALVMARVPAEVLADPFATMGLRVSSGDASARPRLVAEGPGPRDTVPPPSAPPRAIVYPLVSVITADGELHPAELALVDRFLASEGLAPLSPGEMRVHHPSEVAHLVPPARREAVVQLMCETAAVDGMPDESERRVIRAYAAAFGVDEEKLDFWLWGYEAMHTTLARQLWLKLRRFVLSARWA